MSAEIIQFIPRPGHDSEETDFPAIAFRSSLPDASTIRAGKEACELPNQMTPGRDRGRLLNNEGRTFATE